MCKFCINFNNNKCTLRKKLLLFNSISKKIQKNKDYKFNSDITVYKCDGYNYNATAINNESELIFK